MLLSKFKMFAAAVAVATMGVSSAMASVVSPYTFQRTVSGNDCSGVFGQGFANCKDPNGSPIIAKFNTGEEDDQGNQEDGEWELNTGAFPGISQSMFTLVGSNGSTGLQLNGSSGTWSYTGTTGVKITSFVLKAGNQFSWFTMNTPATSFANIAWDTSTLGNKGLSHISFYDTGTTAPIPLPAAGWLMVAGLGGLAALRRRKTA